MALSENQTTQLQSKINQLKEECLTQIKNHSSLSPDTFTNVGDGQLAENFTQQELAHIQHQHAEWQQLEDAQVRLADGILDECVDCGQAISFERLLVEPTAKRCIVCQSKVEADEKRLHIHHA